MKGSIAGFPWLSKFLILAGLFMVIGFILSVAALYLIDFIFPAANFSDLLYNMNSITDAAQFTEKQNQALKLYQFISSPCNFFLTSVIYLYLEGDNFLRSAGLDKKINYIQIVLIILLIFSSASIIGYINQLNQNIILPAGMNTLENSLRTMENQAKVQTDAILGSSTFLNILTTILIVAVAAALCEEIFFRGVVQNLFRNLTGNRHAAIWITAFIFSFIHFQFFGFFPRLLLGALLGYLYFWSGSLWASIVGHFTNNAASIVVYYLTQKNIIENDITENAGLKAALISLPFFLVFLFIYKRSCRRKFEI